MLHIMEYNYGVNSSTIQSKDGREKSVSLIHEPLKEDRSTTLTRNARRNSLGPLHLGMEDDIMSLIGIQDRNGSADMQSVFGMVSYSTS